MKQILKEVFKEQQFHVDTVEDEQHQTVILAKSGIENRVAYFIVVFVENAIPANFLSDYIPMYVDLTKPFWNGRDVVKNTTLLVCVEKQSGVLNTLDPMIHDVEEDPFDFKKLVLVYTRDQVELIEGNRHKQENITDYLQRRLKDHRSFAVFKDNPEAESEYSLITKLFIKLPFLNIPGETRELSDLSQIIDLALGEDLLGLRESIKGLTDEQLDNFSISTIGGVSDE